MVKKSFGAVAALVLALGAVGCEQEETTDIAETPAATESPAAPMDTAQPAGATVRLSEITGNAAAYAGRTVTVEADVEEVLSPMSFLLDEDAPLTGGVDNDLLVLYPRSASLSAIDDQWLNNRVRVTGTVRVGQAVEIEREVGWDMDPQIEAEFEGMKPVLIAKTVQRI